MEKATLVFHIYIIGHILKRSSGIICLAEIGRRGMKLTVLHHFLNLLVFRNFALLLKINEDFKYFLNFYLNANLFY